MKPRLRGRIHQVAFFVAVPAGIVLVALARGPVARAAATIYAVGLVAVFGSSAAYHRGDWSPAALRRMQRLDHAMIFLLIAGTYTPVASLVLEGAWRTAILGAVWTGAVFGVGLKLVRIEGFRILTATLYMVMGWLAIVVLPQLGREMPPFTFALTVAGGLLYTTGAIVFALRRPDPSPSVFGYHEVWHAFIVAGAACHYAMVLILVTR